jgi:hypothetical protein
MKSPMLFLQHVLEDIESGCCISTSRDLETITTRFENEGLSFLTIALPEFGKDFEQALEEQQVTLNHFKGYKRVASKSAYLPAFLGGLLELIFDPLTGWLRADASIVAIQAVRQVTLLYGKIEMECSDARNQEAIDKFVACEQDIKDLHLSKDQLLRFNKMRTRLFGDVLSRLDIETAVGELIPRHGPGKTADGLFANAKYDLREWTQRLESVFPFLDNVLPNPRHYKVLESVDFLEPGRERPVKVTLVPKTPKSPRIIAIEPTCMQYAQQAISRRLVRYLEHPDSYASGFLGFTHQEPNQLMAKRGSEDSSLATIDLSDASDRVSNVLVEELFAAYTNIAEGVQASRSLTATLPRDAGVIQLSKFASMGSALCFPVEAMVFLTIVFCAIQSQHSQRMTDSEILSLKGKVRVYGDDIVVPSEYVHSVMSELEAFGLRVNSKKSFWTGRFRESCGKEYYAGVDVSIVRIRKVFPSSRSNVASVVSLVSTRNQFYNAGYWTTTRFLDEYLGKILGYFPIVEESSQILGRVSSVYTAQAEAIHRDLQIPLVKGWKQVARPPVSPLDGLGALQKFFLSGAFEPLEEGHLERYGRPDAVNIKLGLAPPY